MLSTPQVKSVVLINCGGTLNLLELLQPEDESVAFFIVDSRRPFELDNVYNQDQVNIVLREGETLEVPEFDDIYASDVCPCIHAFTCTCMCMCELMCHAQYILTIHFSFTHRKKTAMMMNITLMKKAVLPAAREGELERR